MPAIKKNVNDCIWSISSVAYRSDGRMARETADEFLGVVYKHMVRGSRDLGYAKQYFRVKERSDRNAVIGSSADGYVALHDKGTIERVNIIF